MTRTTGLFLTAASIAVGLAAYWYLAPRSAPFGMFEGAGQSGTVRFAVSFLATLAGVVCGSAYRELRELQAAGVKHISSMKEAMGNIFRSVDLWLGMAGSPIVYALLLKSSDGMSLSGLTIVALENGFCCLIILNGVLGRAPQATPKE